MSHDCVLAPFAKASRSLELILQFYSMILDSGLDRFSPDSLCPLPDLLELCLGCAKAVENEEEEAVQEHEEVEEQMDEAEEGQEEEPRGAFHHFFL